MNWESTRDPKSGKIYYYNQETKETSWDKPLKLKEQEDNTRDPNNLVTFWIERLDQKTKKIYYYNKKTKKHTWSRPNCLGKEEETALVLCEKERDLWLKTVDPKSRRTYWYHKYNKKSSWRDPYGMQGPKVAKEKMLEKPIAVEGEEGDYIVVDGLFLEKEEEEEIQVDKSEEEKVTEDHTHQIMKKKRSMFARNVDEHGHHETKQRESETQKDEEPLDFAKHRTGFINRVLRVGSIKDDETLQKWKKSPIKKALLKDNRRKDSDAVEIFKNILCYMGDRKTTKDLIAHARSMLQIMMQSTHGIQDEGYIQLVKQTTQNPNIESTIKGWRLMLIVTATFAPTRKVKSYLHQYFEDTVLEEAGNPDVKELAMRCKTWLENIYHIGKRNYIPSPLEVEHVASLKTIPVEIKMMNGDMLPFQADPFTTVGQSTALLVSYFKLAADGVFALYEAGDKNIEKLLDPTTRLLDVMGSWAVRKEVNKELEEADELIYNNFLFKAKLVLLSDLPIINTDPIAISLLYHQALHDICTERYPSVEKDLPALAAIVLQITHGDFRDEYKTNEEWLTDKITELIPAKYVLNNKGEITKEQGKDWKERILIKYEALSGKEFEDMDMKLNYLAQVQTLTFYGSKFFEVEQNKPKQYKHYPSTLMLAINCVGVMIMHPEKTLLLERYSYSEIITWGYSSTKFLIVVGAMVQQRKLYFLTNKGKIMNDLVQDYIRFNAKQSQNS